MKKKEYSKGLFLLLTIVVTFFSVITGNFFTKKVSLRVGEIAKETIYAPFQVENEMATKRKQEQAESEVETIYKIDSSIQEQAIKDIDKLFEYVEGIQKSDLSDMANKTPVDLLSSRSPIALYNEQYENLLLSSEADLKYMKETCEGIATQLLSEGISEQDSNRTNVIRNALEQTKLSSTKQRIAQDIISNVLTVNVVEDEAATNEEKKIARDKVDPVYVLTGEKIIEKGTKVTDETYLLLEKVGYLETGTKIKYKQYMGVILLILLVVGLGSKLCKHFMLSQHLKDKQIILCYILYIVGILITRGLIGINFVYLPLSLSGMIATFATGPVIAGILHLFVVVFSAIIFKGDMVFICYFIIVGLFSIILMNRLQERAQTMISAFLIGLIHFSAYLSLKLFIGTEPSLGLFTEATIAFVMGVILVVIAVGTLPLIESTFEFVTPLQLLELTNPNQPLLKRLLLEATGTYYHSLLVANLAEAAASEIGANPLMARVGGYYHDIGKLTCSSYFKENQGMTNPHDYLTPQQSYAIIVSHVTEGVELAKRYKLPSYLQDMIMQHHGTGTMQFFYAKAKKLGQDVTEEDFQYPGPKPKTKEAALVMLADVVEATTRSMQDKIGVEVTLENVVRKMVKQKLEEGQLDDCMLYISDIDKIIAAFTKMLTGMYHQRIEYPERNEKQ